MVLVVQTSFVIYLCSCPESNESQKILENTK